MGFDLMIDTDENKIKKKRSNYYEHISSYDKFTKVS